jgi:hypothetical protein
VVQFTEDAYSGKEDWVVWAFETWRAHFPLARIIGHALPLSMRQLATVGPTVTIPVEFQAAVYNSTGEFQYVFRREYHVDITGASRFRQVEGGLELEYLEPKGFGDAWPEISVRNFPDPASYPRRLDLPEMAGAWEML